MKKHFFLVLLNIGLATRAIFAGVPFSLADSDPESPEFRANYMGIYGINAAIEPRLQPEDRELYDAVLPLLSSDPEEAIRLLEEAMGPESNAAFNFLLGSLYYMQDRLEEAETQLKLSVEKHPTFRRSHRTLALIYARRDDVPAVVERLLKVITLGGGDGQSYGMLGYAYLRQEKYRAALGAYQNARVFAPDSLDFKRGEAQALLNTEQYQQAIALYDELIADNPSEAEFWLLQANAYLALGERSRAAANLEMARSLDGARYDSLALLASIYMEDGAVDLGTKIAVEAMRKAETRNFLPAIQQLEYLTQRDFMEPADRLAKAFKVSLEPKLDAKQLRRLESACALIDFGLGREREGVSRLEAILKEDPLDGRSLLLLAKHFSKMKEYEEAEYYSERALSVEAFKPEALVTLGQIAVALSDFKKASEFLRKAQSLRFDANVQRYLEQVEEARASSGSLL